MRLSAGIKSLWRRRPATRALSLKVFARDIAGTYGAEWLQNKRHARGRMPVRRGGNR